MQPYNFIAPEEVSDEESIIKEETNPLDLSMIREIEEDDDACLIVNEESQKSDKDKNADIGGKRKSKCAISANHTNNAKKLKMANQPNQEKSLVNDLHQSQNVEASVSSMQCGQVKKVTRSDFKRIVSKTTKKVLSQQLLEIKRCENKMNKQKKSLKELKELIKNLRERSQTRSVGTQVELSPDNEAAEHGKNRQAQQKTIASPLARQIVPKVGQQAAAVGKPAELVREPAEPATADDDNMLTQKSANSGVHSRRVLDANNRLTLNHNEVAPSNNKQVLNSPLQPKPVPRVSHMQTVAKNQAEPVNKLAVASKPARTGFIDLTGENDVVVQKSAANGVQADAPAGSSTSVVDKPTNSSTNPALLPMELGLELKLNIPLPKPLLTVKRFLNKVKLQWEMPYQLDSYGTIACYQLFACQLNASLPSAGTWRKVADFRALALPMMCTLTLLERDNYCFAVRAIDMLQRASEFSDPQGFW